MSTLSLQDLIAQFAAQQPVKNPYVSQEFQDYAYRLAMDLSTPEDRATISLCMRLAKQKPRALLEQARRFVVDARAKNKVALFLWKLKDLESKSAS